MYLPFYLVKQDGILRCLQVKATAVEIIQCLDLGEPVVYTAFSPDDLILLLLSSNVSSKPPQKPHKAQVAHKHFSVSNYVVVHELRQSMLDANQKCLT